MMPLHQSQRRSPVMQSAQSSNTNVDLYSLTGGGTGGMEVTHSSSPSKTVSMNNFPKSDEDELEELRCFVAPLSKEQLVDLVAQASMIHEDVFNLCKSAVSSSPAARRLMVRNIPFSTADGAFLGFFRQFGDIDDAVIVREKDGRSRGYGFVTYKDLDSVRSCLQGNLHLDGKEVYVKLAADTYADKSQRKLFIRNLPDSATEDMLRIVFSQFGKIEECSVVKSKDGLNKGYGFLTFSTHREAFKAVQQQERVIDQRVVFIHFATPPPDKRKESLGSGNGQVAGGGGNRGPRHHSDRPQKVRGWGTSGSGRKSGENAAVVMSGNTSSNIDSNPSGGNGGVANTYASGGSNNNSNSSGHQSNSSSNSNGMHNSNSSNNNPGSVSIGSNGGVYRVELHDAINNMNGSGSSGVYAPYPYHFTPNMYHINHPHALPLGYSPAGSISHGPSGDFYPNSPGAGRF